MSEVGTRLSSGTDLLNTVSTTLRTLQRSGNSANTVGGLLGSVIGVLSGNGEGGAGANALAELTQSQNITSALSFLTPFTV